MFVLWLIWALVSFVISAFLSAIVFMFTTIAGLVLLGVFVLVFIGNLMAPSEDEDDEEED